MTWWQVVVVVVILGWAIGHAADRIRDKLHEILIELRRQGPGDPYS